MRRPFRSGLVERTDALMVEAGPALPVLGIIVLDCGTGSNMREDGSTSLYRLLWHPKISTGSTLLYSAPTAQQVINKCTDAQHSKTRDSWEAGQPPPYIGKGSP